MFKYFLIFLNVLILTSVSLSQWSEQTSGVTTALESVSPIDNNIVWIAGASGKVLYTSNGGTNWIIAASPNPAIDMSNIFGINATTALVTGSSSTATFVYRTTNTGTSWTQVFTQSGGFIDAIIINSGGAGWMYGDPVGGRWSIWLTTNQGVSWDSTHFYIPQAGSEAGWNNAMAGASTSFGGYFWFGTNNSIIYRAKLQSGIGMTWTAQPTTGIPNIYSILFTDSLNGIAGGSSGLAYTNSSGSNWIINTGVMGSGNITGVAVKGTQELWFARGSSIYYTPNDSVWSLVYTQTGTYNHLARTMTPSNNNIWAVRSNGGISKYTYPIGIKKIRTEIPNSYSLYQNYPNPFNPSTTIKFDVPFTSYVIITVYDVNGRGVTKLIDEKLTPGSYETKFDASNLSSGMYFYKLETNGFSETKKMILVK